MYWGDGNPGNGTGSKKMRKLRRARRGVARVCCYNGQYFVPGVVPGNSQWEIPDKDSRVLLEQIARHGNYTVSEVVAKGVEFGCDVIAITDHADRDLRAASPEYPRRLRSHVGNIRRQSSSPAWNGISLPGEGTSTRPSSFLPAPRSFGFLWILNCILMI